MTAAAFAHDRFRIEQLVRPVANVYRVTPLAAGDSPAGAPVAFVRQKRMAFKEDIRFFGDEDERQELFRIRARSMLDVRGRYDVTTPDGERIGVLEKVFGRSLLSSTWRILDRFEREVGLAQERSQAVAVVRRVVDLVPYGELVPIPYHFTLLRDGRELGELTRERALRDRYTLDLVGDPDRTIDRRVAIALAVALDALQSR